MKYIVFVDTTDYVSAQPKIEDDIRDALSDYGFKGAKVIGTAAMVIEHDDFVTDVVKNIKENED